MFFIYYGYKGIELDQKIRAFQNLRKDPVLEIEFGEFLGLMGQLNYKIAVPPDSGGIAGRPQRTAGIPAAKISPRRATSPGKTSPQKGIENNANYRA